MASKSTTNAPSAFEENGFRESVERIIDEIQSLYLSDEIPWVVGYSGGKDSSATLQLVWTALAQLPKDKRKKPVFVITTDTLVENPVVAAWVDRSLAVMEEAATKAGLPIYPNKLTPELKDTFWVNLIGRGYPAPRPKFRWCTERMKINPADAFITGVVRQNGEAIVVLGTRKAESSVRSGRMKDSEARTTRDGLHTHSSLQNAYVYAPIADWSNDDVWLFLMRIPNPWGHSNKDLLTLYQGASADGECPLVIDTTTPSCGNSRFGCWVCTLVDKDKSMSAMIQNDEDKDWLEPLLDLRNELDQHDHNKRDFRRMTGHITLYGEDDSYVPGPYTQTSREDWLRKLLQAQQAVRNNPNTPPHVRDIELISEPELHEIRRIWVSEKYEVEDRLPAIFEEVTGETWGAKPINDVQPFGAVEMGILKELCADDALHFELVRELLEVERSYRGMAKRGNLYSRIEKAVRRGFYDSVEDATDRARLRKNFDRLIENLDQADFDFTSAARDVANLVETSDGHTLGDQEV